MSDEGMYGRPLLWIFVNLLAALLVTGALVLVAAVALAWLAVLGLGSLAREALEARKRRRGMARPVPR